MLRYATKRYNLWRRTCNCMISRTHKGVAKIAVFFIHEPNTVLSVPYSCCATLWNGTSYKHGLHRGHHQKRLEQRLFLLLSDNLTVDFGFLALQDKYNIRALGKYKFALASKHARNIPVIKAHKNKLYITCNVRITYMYICVFR